MEMSEEWSWPIALAFILYLAGMMCIGLYYSRQQKNLSSYILGDRKLGPWLTSMSAEASDMSGWMLMGLPGYAYLHGLSAFWTGIGLIIGTWANWVLVSTRLRHYTEVANNSLTIPDYLRTASKKRRMACASSAPSSSFFSSSFIHPPDSLQPASFSIPSSVCPTSSPF